MAPVSIKDVGEWLQGLGLGRYEAKFREHELRSTRTFCRN